MKEVYNILCNGRKIYSNLSEEEYFNIMEDLAAEFYQTGSPNPNEIKTEIIEEQPWQSKNHPAVSKKLNHFPKKRSKEWVRIQNILPLLAIKQEKNTEGKENRK